MPWIAKMIEMPNMYVLIRQVQPPLYKLVKEHKATRFANPQAAYSLMHKLGLSADTAIEEDRKPDAK